jgi:hypothetical protein
MARLKRAQNFEGILGHFEGKRKTRFNICEIAY